VEKTVERFELSTMLRRTLTAFKTLTFTPLLVALGCDAGGTTRRPNQQARAAAATAMPSPASPTSVPPPSLPAQSAEAAAAKPGLGKYGAPLGESPTGTLRSILGEPDRYAGKSVRVEGHVRRSCSAMGCWMELAESAAPDAPACRVMMKGHAFFVPTDSAGSSARVEGSLDLKRIPPAQVEHMEAEGAQFAHKNADGSAEEVRFVASGVELWRG
jgi:hypothetical protein